MTDFGTRGTRLWDALIAQDASLDDELSPMREVAISACRTADRVETLESLAAVTDVTLEERGAIKTHPVHIEVRNQAALLTRLVAALRLPDQANGKRPQRRQVRGVQQPSKVSSLDRARATKSS